VTYIVH